MRIAAVMTASVLIAAGAGCLQDSPLPPTVESVADGLKTPTGLAVTSDGTVLVAESGAGRIARIDAMGVVSAYSTGFTAGTFFPYDIGPLSLLFQSDGTLIVGEGGNGFSRERVSFVDAMGAVIEDRMLTPVSGSDFGALAIHPTTGDLYIASAGSDRIFRAAVVEAGGFSQPAEFIANTAEAPIGRRAPSSLAFQADGALLAGFADFGGGAIVRLDTAPDAAALVKDELYTAATVVTALAIRPSDGAIFFTEATYAANRLGSGRIAQLEIDDQGRASAKTFADSLTGPSALVFAEDDTMYFATLGSAPNQPVGAVQRVAAAMPAASTNSNETTVPTPPAARR